MSTVFRYLQCRVPHRCCVPCPVAMFHGSTSDRNKKHVMSEFPKPDSVLRVIVCTIAFGLGIDVPDIRCVVNFGTPSSVEDFVQESGRAGRDGEAAKSILYYTSKLKNRHTDDAMLRYCSKDISCRRQYLSQYFRLDNVEEYPAPEVKSASHCCDLCVPSAR